jgi:hypothetical protein
MFTNDRKRIAEAIDNGPADLRVAEAQKHRADVAADVVLCAEREERLRLAYHDGLQRWNEWSGHGSPPPPRIDPAKARAGTALLLITLILMAFDGLISAWAATQWLASAVRYRWLVGIVLTFVATAIGTLVWAQLDDERRPAPTVAKLKKAASWVASIGVVFMMAFAFLRVYVTPDTLYYLSIVLTAMSATFGLAAGASYLAATVYRDLNVHVVRPFLQVRAEHVSTSALLSKLEQLCQGDADSHPEHPEPPLATHARPVAVNTGTPGVSESPSTDQAPASDPVNRVGTVGPLRGVPTLLAMILLPLLAAGGAQAMARTLPEDVKVRLDISGSCDTREVHRVLLSLAEPPPTLECFATISRVEGYVWATGLDAVRGPQVTKLVQRPEIAACVKGEDDFAAIERAKEKACRSKQSAERQRYRAELRSAFAQIVAELDRPRRSAGQTCFWQLLERAANDRPNALDLVITDGVHEACKPPLNLPPVRSKLLVILVPNTGEGDNTEEAMRGRAVAIRAKMRGVLVVQSTDVDASWEWLRDSLGTDCMTR